MPPPRGSDSGAPERRFFLSGPPVDGNPPALLPEDEQHALRVVRVGTGDRLVGLDGIGAAWPLVVTAVERNRLALEQAGEPERDPAPGSDAASRPWIELCCALPKPNRLADMIDRLTQLGVCRISPVVFEQSATRELSEGRHEKLARVAREACKQSGNAWLPELAPPLPLAQSEPGAPHAVVLVPGAPSSLSGWAHEAQPSRVTVYVGPEGGLRDAERTLLVERGAIEVRLTPTVLRIETASELAVGTLNQR